MSACLQDVRGSFPGYLYLAEHAGLDSQINSKRCSFRVSLPYAKLLTNDSVPYTEN